MLHREVGASPGPGDGFTMFPVPPQPWQRLIPLPLQSRHIRGIALDFLSIRGDFLGLNHYLMISVLAYQSACLPGSPLGSHKDHLTTVLRAKRQQT